MSEIINKLSDILAVKDKEPAIWCEACGLFHTFYVNSYSPKGELWVWDKNPWKPTFNPSFYKKRKDGEICHFIVKNGQIQYQHDSTHYLKGQTRELSALPHWY